MYFRLGATIQCRSVKRCLAASTATAIYMRVAILSNNILCEFILHIYIYILALEQTPEP